MAINTYLLWWEAQLLFDKNAVLIRLCLKRQFCWVILDSALGFRVITAESLICVSQALLWEGYLCPPPQVLRKEKQKLNLNWIFESYSRNFCCAYKNRTREGGAKAIVTFCLHGLSGVLYRQLYHKIKLGSLLRPLILGGVGREFLLWLCSDSLQRNRFRMVFYNIRVIIENIVF